MNVVIKQFSVDMVLKNNGIELDISNGDGHLGDLYVAKKGLTWCPGKTARKNGKEITWERFMKLMDEI